LISEKFGLRDGSYDQQEQMTL